MTPAEPKAAGPDVSGTVFEHGSEELARTYAQAFLNLLEPGEAAEPAVAELVELVDDIWGANPEFAALLSNDFVHADRRDEILEKVFGGQASPKLVDFLRVVNRRGRLGLLPMVAKIARQIQNKRTKRVDVAVRTAVALSDDEAEKLAGNLASLLGGRKPVLKREVDPSILGGLVVQVGDRVYDASIRTNLENFRQHLLNRRHREIRERREHLYQMPS